MFFLHTYYKYFYQALFWACESLVKESSALGSGRRQLSFHKRSVSKLLEFEGNGPARDIIGPLLIVTHRKLEFEFFFVSIVQKCNLIPFNVSGEYDAVIICLGAKVNMLPEISGRLPLRTCRGVILHMELPEDIG